MKKIYILIVLILFNHYSSQRKVDSPFKIQDYFKMKDEFVDYTEKHRDKVLEIENHYYSTKKLDSILLIKEKVKRQYLSENYQKKSEQITENDLKNVKDQDLLRYAVFYLKKNNFSYTFENNSLIIYNKNYDINVDNISKDNNYDITECIISKIPKIITCNTFYHKNFTLKYTRNNKNNQEFGISKEFDENGKLTKQIDWDNDFLINYSKAKILTHNYLKNYILKQNEEYIRTNQVDKNYFKNNNFNIENFLKNIESKGGIGKTQLENGTLAWYGHYEDFEISIDAKTGKLIQCNRIYMIP